MVSFWSLAINNPVHFHYMKKEQHEHSAKHLLSFTEVIVIMVWNKRKWTKIMAVFIFG